MKHLKLIAIFLVSAAFVFGLVSCEEQDYVEAVTFSSAKNKSNGLDISMSSATKGATIYYTTDGTNPSKGSLVYSEAISITKTTEFRAFAQKEDFEDSPISFALFEFTSFDEPSDEEPSVDEPSDEESSDETFAYSVIVKSNNSWSAEHITLASDSEKYTISVYFKDLESDSILAGTSGNVAADNFFSAGAPFTGDIPFGSYNLVVEFYDKTQGKTYLYSDVFIVTTEDESSRTIIPEKDTATTVEVPDILP